MTEAKKPKVSSENQKELDKMQEQFDAFDKQVKDCTLDRMNAAPQQEQEMQTKISQVDIEKMNDVYLKPSRAIMAKEKFNEEYREAYNFSKEYIQFIAENKECPGNIIEIWTKAFSGIPCEFWSVPVNKPVWGPRYLAEAIKKCSYHILSMQESISEGAGNMQFYGKMVVDSVKQRLDATPVSGRKSIFMGASPF